jgi:hypothetical protein
MKIAVAVLLTFALASLTQARIIESLSYPDLFDKADLVVIAKVISTQDTTERAQIIGLPGQFVGLSTEFEIRVVMKGDKNMKECVLHHYRLLNPKQRIKAGPMLACFDPKQRTRFLLFLRREADGRYSPVSGQVDPASCSIQPLKGDDQEADD